MKELLGIFPLRNCHTGEYEDAELYTPIDEQNVEDFETKWLPLLKKRLSTLAEHEDAISANVQDAHWKWRDKWKERDGRIDYDSFSVECNGVTQGMMFVRSIAFAKEPSQINQHLIYIDFLAIAPLNRPGFSELRLYKGIGPLLLGTAINYSIEQGFEGRIGLHAIPQSETWYGDECGMTDLGIDLSYPQSLRYFEMTAIQARTYITT